MGSFKVDRNWGETLLSYQNEPTEQSYCDRKLIGADGYVMVHDAILPRLKTASNSSKSTEDLMLPNTTLQTLSKLVFLLYTGDALMSKVDQQALKEAFSKFKMTRLKRHLFASKVNTRRSSSGGVIHKENMSETKEKLVKRKIRGVKYLDQVGQETEEIFVFGDGSTMAVPVSGEQRASHDSSLCYDENGSVAPTLHANAGFPCYPCSTIFCDEDDFNEHLQHCTQSSFTPTLTKIKLEHQVVKLEVETASQVIDPCVCLICNSFCLDVQDFLLHNGESHSLTESDYNTSTGKCESCNELKPSLDLPAFLHHVYKCKQSLQQQRKRKRCDDTASSTNGGIGKRMKTARNHLFQLMRSEAMSSSERIDSIGDLETAIHDKACEIPNLSLGSFQEDNIRIVTPTSHVFSDTALETSIDKEKESAFCLTIKSFGSETVSAKITTEKTEKAEPVKPRSERNDVLKAAKVKSSSCSTHKNVTDQETVNENQEKSIPKEKISTKLRSSPSKLSASVNVKTRVSEEQEAITKTPLLKTREPSLKYLSWKCYRCITYFSCQNFYMYHECQ